MGPSRIMHVDARIELPVETARLFGSDPTKDTPASERLMATVPGASQLFPGGMLGDAPVLDLYLEGAAASEQDLSMILLELDGQLMALMDEAGDAS